MKGKQRCSSICATFVLPSLRRWIPYRSSFSLFPAFRCSFNGANQEGVEPYMVVQRRSIVEIIRMRPSNLKELGFVWGFGPARVSAVLIFSSLMRRREGNENVCDIMLSTG